MLSSFSGVLSTWAKQNRPEHPKALPLKAAAAPVSNYAVIHKSSNSKKVHKKAESRISHLEKQGDKIPNLQGFVESSSKTPHNDHFPNVSNLLFRWGFLF